MSDSEPDNDARLLETTAEQTVPIGLASSVYAGWAQGEAGQPLTQRASVGAGGSL